MPSKTGRTLRLLLLAAPGLALLPYAATGETAADNSEMIGPWAIEAAYNAGKFDRCTISRKLDDDIIATFMRTGGGLTLLLSSPNWKLERGKQYPVTMKLGAQSWDREVAAEARSVSMEVDDAKFERSLKSAKALNVVAAGATIHVPLDSSTAAFDRLDRCVEKNERAVESNPFCGPGTPALKTGVPDGQAPACKESTETATVEPQSTGAVDAAADAPPPPEAKPVKVDDQGEEKAEPKSKTKPKTKTAKKRTTRSLRREVERLFSAPGRYLSGQ